MRFCLLNGERNLAVLLRLREYSPGCAETQKYASFRTCQPVLQKLLLKGSIVVKKAYCDWDRYKVFKATMHEAAFELIEIPHVPPVPARTRQTSAMVVDALRPLPTPRAYRHVS